MGRIIHGNQSFGYAPIVTSDDTQSFGSPVMMPGMVSYSMEIEQESLGIPADNNPNYATIKGAKVRTANGTFRYIPSAYASFLGFKVDSNGGLTDTGSFPPHCIFFETIEEDPDLGIKTRTLHYLYSVVGSEPANEGQTDEESIEAREISVDYTCRDSFVTDEDGVVCQYYHITRTDENAALYDTFKTAVILPGQEVPSV